MKTFLDYYNTKATLENDEKASNGEFTMYYTTKRNTTYVTKKIVVNSTNLRT